MKRVVRAIATLAVVVVGAIVGSVAATVLVWVGVDGNVATVVGTEVWIAVGYALWHGSEARREDWELSPMDLES